MFETDLRVLRQSSVPVNIKRENLELLFIQLEEALANSERPGIGLAAIQLGIPRQTFIIKAPGKAEIRVWNPTNIVLDGDQVVGEGCLSLPNFSRSVHRATNVRFTNGDGRTYVLDDLEAVIFQHENDHIRGVVLSDKPIAAVKIGRNEPCPCGKRTEQGGILKFKKCCGKT